MEWILGEGEGIAIKAPVGDIKYFTVDGPLSVLLATFAAPVLKSNASFVRLTLTDVVRIYRFRLCKTAKINLLLLNAVVVVVVLILVVVVVGLCQEVLSALEFLAQH